MTDFSSREPEGWGEMEEAVHRDTVYQEAVSQATCLVIKLESSLVPEGFLTAQFLQKT